MPSPQSANPPQSEASLRDLLIPVLSSEQMRRWDQRAIERLGVPGRVLMESAGRAAARVLQRLYPRGRVAVAVGRGNNGGDAVVLLRTLRAWGRDVVAVPVDAAALRSELLHGWRVPTVAAEQAAEAFASADLLVDGLLGTGARGAPRPPFDALIRRMGESGRPVLALDGPSGVDLDSGRAEGDAVRAAVTVTFGAPKCGLLRFPGRERAGRIVVVETGFPPLEPDHPAARLVTPAWARARLPAAPPDAHKGDLGRVVVVAGRSGVAGAAIMLTTAVLRAGAGGAWTVSPAANRMPVQTAVPEAIFVDRDDAELDARLRSADALAVGPGMGTDQDARALLRRVLRAGDAPLLLDADALTLLAAEPALRALAGERALLLTPHPGEMGRLLERPIPDVTSDPFAAAAEAAERFRCAVLLKGAPSVVAAPGQPTLVSVAGHSGVATGGMGDTLAGVAAALLALGLPARDAGALALHTAGRAAEIAGRGRGLLPRDVAEALPAALLDPGNWTGEAEAVLELE